MKLKAFLQRLTVSSDLRDLAERHRIDGSIPEDGFSSQEEFVIWRKCFSEDEFLENFNKFLSEALKVVPYQKILSRNGFIWILYNYYFHFREFDIDALTKEFENDLFDVVAISGKGSTKKKTDLLKGIYLRIPTDSTKSDIKRFIDDYFDKISQDQKSFSKEQGYQDLNIGVWKEYSRDNLISRIYRLPDHVLEEHFGVKKTHGQYRSQFVANILKEESEFKDISEDAVDKAIKRFNQRKNWPKGHRK